MTETETALRWVEMRDAADPRQLDTWTGPVAGYPIRYPPAISWTRADFQLHAQAGYMKVSERSEPYWAALCREIAVEDLAASAGDVPAFLAYREHLGHDDGGVYVDMYLWPSVKRVLEWHGIGPARVRVRIAKWDGDPGAVPLLGGGYQVWAKQFASLPGYDRNAVYGETDFSHG